MTTHSLSRALNIEYLDDSFVRAMQNSWSRETCWPGCIDDYPDNPEDNPAYGNCFVTVLAAWAQRGFDGVMQGGLVDESAWHFRLGIRTPETSDPVYIDPTWQQFEETATFRPLSWATPSMRYEYQIVITESLNDPSLPSRLNLFLDKMTENGCTIAYDADDIIQKAKASFGPAYGPNRPPPQTSPFAAP